jgi:hypothetical protein
MKKYLIIAALVLSTITLSACGSQKTETIQSATVTKSGLLQIKSGDVYLLSTDDGIVNITSTKAKLDNYLKKNITVTGMYSGDILYVDTIN